MSQEDQVRALAEEIASSQYNRNSMQAKAWRTVAGRWQRRITEFLAEMEEIRAPANGSSTPSASEKVQRLVKSCSRCGGDHPVEFARFERPAAAWSHWGLCPVTGEPILMKPGLAFEPNDPRGTGDA